MVYVPESVAAFSARDLTRYARVRASFGSDKRIALLLTCPVQVHLQSRSWETHEQHRDLPKEMPLLEPPHRPNPNCSENDFSIGSKVGDLERPSIEVGPLH